MSANESVCSPAPKLIFACSGAADVGAIADQAARKMTQDGSGRMFCLAGVGGRVPAIMDATASAFGILALDGCALDCARHCVEQAGFTGLAHLRVTDLGFAKGSSEVSAASVAKVAAAGALRLASR